MDDDWNMIEKCKQNIIKQQNKNDNEIYESKKKGFKLISNNSKKIENNEVQANV